MAQTQKTTPVHDQRPSAKGHLKPMQAANVNCLMMIMSLESEAPSLHLPSQMTKSNSQSVISAQIRQSPSDNSCPKPQPHLDVSVTVNC